MADWQVEKLNLSKIEIARQVFDIQRAAYRVEADLIGFDGIPPLHESFDDLVAGSLIWIGICIDGRVAAALAYQLVEDLCDIDRLVVAPEHFGKGLASALLTTLLDHPRITVSTASGNTPARRLYEKHGFQVASERPIAPGITSTHYERRSQRRA